jgi:transposase
MCVSPTAPNLCGAEAAPELLRDASGLAGKPVGELAKEIGINRNQLYRWLRDLGNTAAPMPKQESDAKRSNRRPQDWTPEEKLEVVMKSMGLADEALGAFLRSQGLHKADLDEWRASVLKGARAELTGNTQGKSREQKRIRELERELNRKEKALAEAAALLVLKKKMEAIWGDEDDGTDPTSER